MSARSADTTERNPAVSSASATVLRSDAHTSGAPAQRKATAAFSGIVAAGACAGGGGADPRAGAAAPPGAFTEPGEAGIPAGAAGAAGGRPRGRRGPATAGAAC